ncbi:MAG TPA: DNA polymerase Y family protein [Beijerinckiaceae bacterium]|nr:DNA polymerase Y family protein [Beijerinckiaceae bacterium]
MTRYLSLWLPDLAIESLRRAAPDPKAAAALWAAQGGGRRIVAVNFAARQLGLAPGPTLAVARAMHPSLALVQADPLAQARCLDAILAWSRRFTPLAALDPPDGIMLDISGVAHLFGGEAALGCEIEHRLAQQGFLSRAARANSPELAFALARFAPGVSAPDDQDDKALMRLVSSLPLAALRLSPEKIAGLAQAGLRRIGDILHRPRAPLAARWGKDLFRPLDAMLGREKSAISPVFEAPAYLVERRFADGIARREDIEATILALAHDLGRMLERHGEGLRRVEASLFRVDGVVKHIAAGASRPLRDPKIIGRLFRERIETIGEQGLDTGYGFDLIRLAALEVEPLAPLQTLLVLRKADFGEAGASDLFQKDAAHEDLADLIDRLGARLGWRRVLRLCPQDSFIPEFAVTATPFTKLERAPIWPRAFAHMPAPTRPIRLLEKPERVETIAAVPDGPPLRFRWRRLMHEVAAVEGPERIAPEWWKGEESLTRDYFRIEDTNGRRFWLYRQGLYGTETTQPRWFMHGLFG